MIEPEEWLSQAEAARRRNVSKQAIAKLIKRGRLRTLQVGGHVLVHRDDVDNFVAQKAGRPKQEKTVEKVERVRQLIQDLTPEEQRELLIYIRSRVQRHPLEQSLNIDAEAVLDAIDRADELIMRNIRGVIAEAAFGRYVLSKLAHYTSHNPAIDADKGQYSDYVLSDQTGYIYVQVKLQRSEQKQPKVLGNGFYAVEVQRTRTGVREVQSEDEEGKTITIQEKTRPYRPGQFDILAVCMYPSTNDWGKFLYTLSKWLVRNPKNKSEIKVIQPVPQKPDNETWTDNLDTCVQWLRSDVEKTISNPPTPRKTRVQ
jgi:excisionase family DNA binding protein